MAGIIASGLDLVRRDRAWTARHQLLLIASLSGLSCRAS